MTAFGRSKIVLPLAAAFTVFAFSAQAQAIGGASGGDTPHAKGPPPGAHPAPAARPAVGGAPGPRVGGGAPGAGPRIGGGPPGAGPRVGGGPPGARVVHGGPIPARNFAGHAYRGHLAWEGGRWHHQVYNGRMGWWWDVGGVWYFYPERFDGPPAYVSEDYADDAAYDAGPAPVAGAYAPPPGAYPPPPPPPDPGAAGVGGAIIGGVLGGLITGRASGAAAGAVIGGLTGATAAAHEGYWLSNGGCYYRYPSGQYVVADPRWCY
jgi:hypothetical protein